MNKKKIQTLLLISAFVLSGNVGFCAKSIKINNQSKKTLSASVADYRLEYVNKQWWERFEDPILNEYIYKAYQTNHDLKLASLRVQETQQLVKEMTGKELPTVGVGTSYQNYIINDMSLSNLMMPVSASYEIDLWGKNKLKTQSESKKLEIAQDEEKAIFISLTSAVASTYFNIVKTDKMIDLQKDILKLNKNIYKLTKEKNENGLCPVTDVISAEKTFTESEIAMNDLQKQQRILLNQLAVYTGESIDDARTLKRTSIDNINLVKNLPVDINSEIVKERPDILKSESELKKSGVDVKIARRDFLPSIVISGEYGFTSLYMKNIGDFAGRSKAPLGMYGISLTDSIFSGGQKKARLKQKKIKYEQSLEQYQKTILQSFQEVNDALISLKTSKKNYADNTSRVKLESKNYELIDYKYQVGSMAYLDTLNYKARLLSLQKEKAASKAQCLVDTLTLYKAIGGKNLFDKKPSV